MNRFVRGGFLLVLVGCNARALDVGLTDAGQNGGPDADCLATHSQCACTTNQQCIDANGGRPYVCAKNTGQCISLISADCKQLDADPEDVANDKTVWIGAMVDLSGPGKTEGQGLLHAIEFARREIKANIAGLAARPAEPPRPLGVVICDEMRDPSQSSYLDAEKYLVEDLHVPAILGGMYSTDTIKMLQTEALPHNVLHFGLTTSSPAFTALQKDDGAGHSLFYRAIASDNVVAAAMAQAVGTSLEPTLRSTGVVTSEMRVALVVDASFQVFAQELLSTLVFNGKSVVDNGSNFLSIQYSVSATPAEFAAVVQKIDTFQPNLVIGLGTDAFYSSIMGPTEAQWPSTAPRPYWWFPASPSSALLTVLGTNADLAKRQGAFVGGSRSPQYQLWGTTYAAAFPDAPPPNLHTPLGYDAVYTIALAIVANGTNDLTGPNLSARFATLIPGAGRTKIPLGPNSFFQALQILTGGGAIDIDGVSGSLDFDLTTGDAPQDVQFICPNQGTSLGYYDPVAKKLVGGPFQCP
jgi:ABC-type branched-subunit amino acid transport system substrate-binding protein